MSKQYKLRVQHKSLNVNNKRAIKTEMNERFQADNNHYNDKIQVVIKPLNSLSLNTIDFTTPSWQEWQVAGTFGFLSLFMNGSSPLIHCYTIPTARPL